MSSLEDLKNIEKKPLKSGKKEKDEKEIKELAQQVEKDVAETLQPVEEQIEEIKAKAAQQIEELKQKDAKEHQKQTEEIQKKRGRKANPDRAAKDYLSVDIYGMRDALKILCMREAKARNENEIPLGVYISELVKKDIEANKEYIDTVSKYI